MLKLSSRRARRIAVTAFVLAGIAVILIVAVNGENSGGGSSTANPGWGPKTAAYLGRYRVLSGSGANSSNGELTLFMRTVKGGKPPEPSGILALRLSGENDVFYLTDLSRKGSSRIAQVHLGSFLGPVIGRLHGTSSATGEFAGTMSLASGKATLHFVRFSADPSP